MIIDSIANISIYSNCHPSFNKAFKFIKANNLLEMDEGRYEIDGDNIFAIVADVEGKSKDEACLEIHRKYIDIQLCVKGVDYIGWKNLNDCSSPKAGYDPESDLQFFYDKIETWCEVKDGMFSVFFPDDAHAPLGGKGLLRKVIIKIAV